MGPRSVGGFIWNFPSYWPGGDCFFAIAWSPSFVALVTLRPDEEGFTLWLQHQLCLTFLPLLPDGESLAIALLECAPEDFRDGVLHACYRLNTRPIYEAVKANVRRWEQDIWCGDSTGERWLVHRLVKRWDESFPEGDHEDIRRLCEFS